MFPQPEVIAKVTCYCCGYEGAEIIKNPLGNSPDSLEFVHKECGQKTPFQEALLQMFKDKGISVDVRNISAGVNKKISLYVSNYRAKSTWEIVKKIIANLGDYPLTVTLYISDQINCCPICNERKFFRKGGCVVCENDGLTVSVENYLYGFLNSQDLKYQSANSPYGTVNDDKMFTVHSGYNMVGWIILRTNEDGDQIVIVGGGDPNQNSSTRFKNLILNLNDNFPEDEKERFRIIIAKKS